jgi:UDP-glucuronate 4-epimerase
MKNILVTGAIGFIGFHLTKKLLENKNLNVFGVDNINNYYDVRLKKSRYKILKKNKRFFLYKLDISNQKKLEILFKKYKFDKVINLAAQAGVRYSISNPDSYFKSNVIGFYNILKLSAKYKIKHLIYASTSSVYGDTNSIPFKESDDTNKPIQFYAATKKSNEVMAYSFSSIYKLPTTGLRFFTVYGPWGRPDMALFKFTKNILNGKPIPIFNFGNHNRDFTFIDDIINGILKIFYATPKKNKNKISAEVYNIGRGKKEKLLKYINIIKETLQRSYKPQFLKKQKGDIKETLGDINKIRKNFKYSPKTNINVGIPKFINWYKEFYKKNK